MDKNENATCPNVWDTAKTLHIGTFLFANAYIKKEEVKLIM